MVHDITIFLGEETENRYTESEVMQPHIDYLNKCTVLDTKPAYEAEYCQETNSLCISKLNIENGACKVNITKAYKAVTIGGLINYQLDDIKFNNNTEPMIIISGTPILTVNPLPFIRILNKNMIEIKEKTAFLRLNYHLLKYLDYSYDNGSKNNELWQIYPALMQTTEKLLNTYKKTFCGFEKIENAHKKIKDLIEARLMDLPYNADDLIEIIKSMEEYTLTLIENSGQKHPV